MHCGYRILVKGSYEATKAVAKKAQKKKFTFKLGSILMRFWVNQITVYSTS